MAATSKVVMKDADVEVEDDLDDHVEDGIGVEEANEAGRVENPVEMDDDVGDEIANDVEDEVVVQ